VKYSLSEEAQLIWGAKSETITRATLYHYPVLPSVYESAREKLAVDVNPFSHDTGLKYDVAKATDQSIVVPRLVRAACGENHVALQDAWKAVIDAGMPEEALRELTQPPFDEARFAEYAKQLAALDSDEARVIVAEWSKLFAEKCAKALSIAKQKSARQ
jgi:hypothetical protein